MHKNIGFICVVIVNNYTCCSEQQYKTVMGNVMGWWKRLSGGCWGGSWEVGKWVSEVGGMEGGGRSVLESGCYRMGVGGCWRTGVFSRRVLDGGCRWVLEDVALAEHRRLNLVEDVAERLDADEPVGMPLRRRVVHSAEDVVVHLHADVLEHVPDLKQRTAYVSRLEPTEETPSFVWTSNACLLLLPHPIPLHVRLVYLTSRLHTAWFCICSCRVA